MDIFPIGTISPGSNNGTIDSVSYSFFEPNAGCESQIIKNILVTSFEQQTRLTRKKSEPYLTVVYTYESIFHREYKQIEHFIYSVADDALNPFYVVDFSQGVTPSSIADSSGDWVVSIDDTRLFSTIENMKADRAFLWNGTGWKEGRVTGLSTNTSITVDVINGNLSLASAQTNAIAYPLYSMYAVKNVINQFKKTDYVQETINTSNDGGFMRSGNIAFVSRYKV